MTCWECKKKMTPVFRAQGENHSASMHWLCECGRLEPVKPNSEQVNDWAIAVGTERIRCLTIAGYDLYVLGHQYPWENKSDS
jgi:hypothetical protein